MYLLVIFDNKALLRHVDTIQKLTDILVAGNARLVDKSARARHIFDRVAADFNLILHVSRADDFYTRGHVDDTGTLLTQKVTDFHSGAIIGQIHVKGKMGIDEFHLVQVALGHTSDHVGNVRTNGANLRLLAGISQPTVDNQGFGRFLVDVKAGNLE